MFTILSGLITAAAAISTASVSALPVVGPAVAASTTLGANTTLSAIVGGAVTTATNGAALSAAKSIRDIRTRSRYP